MIPQTIEISETFETIYNLYIHTYIHTYIHKFICLGGSEKVTLKADVDPTNKSVKK